MLACVCRPVSSGLPNHRRRSPGTMAPQSRNATMVVVTCEPRSFAKAAASSSSTFVKVKSWKLRPICVFWHGLKWLYLFCNFVNCAWHPVIIARRSLKTECNRKIHSYVEHVGGAHCYSKIRNRTTRPRSQLQNVIDIKFLIYFETRKWDSQVKKLLRFEE